jgi:hypothetical protein
MILLVGVAGLSGGCALMTPTVKRSTMSLADADITGMECRHGATTGTSIPKTVCASPDKWKKYDATLANDSAELFHDILDKQDNRILYFNH